ncbi:MAG: O-antigen polymerase [Phycisphaerales bacterium]
MTRCLIHPLYLFLLVWGGAVALYLGGVHEGLFPCPSSLTGALLCLNVVTFALGYATWALFQDLNPAPVEPPRVPARPLTQKAMARALKFTLAMGATTVGLEMWRVVAVASYYRTTWLDLVTQPELFRIRMVAFVENTLFQTSGIVMLLSVTSSLFSIGFVLLGISLYRDSTRKKYLYLISFLAVSLTIGLIHLTRYEVTWNILYLVFAYWFMAWLNRPDDRIPERSMPRSRFRMANRRLLVPLVVLATLFGLVDLLLHKSSDFGLPGRLQGWLFHFYWYIAAPLATFNEFVATFHGDLQWGQGMFLPLYKWLCRFHLVSPVEVSFYGEKVFIPYMSNVYTYLRNIYEDFGIWGVAVVPYLLGWGAAEVRVRARRTLQFLNLYLVLLLFLLFSFYNFSLVSNQIYLQVFFGFVLFRYSLQESPTAGDPVA